MYAWWFLSGRNVPLFKRCEYWMLLWLGVTDYMSCHRPINYMLHWHVAPITCQALRDRYTWNTCKWIVFFSISTQYGQSILIYKNKDRTSQFYTSLVLWTLAISWPKLTKCFILIWFICVLCWFEGPYFPKFLSTHLYIINYIRPSILYHHAVLSYTGHQKICCITNRRSRESGSCIRF